MKCTFVVFLCLVAAATAQYVSIMNCGSNGGKGFDARIPGCKGNQMYCKVKHGQKTEIEIDFLSYTDENEVTVDAKALDETGQTDSQFAMTRYGDANACKESGITCPVKKNVKLTYKNYFSVEEKSVKKLKIQYKFTNKDKKVLGCADVYVEIQQ